MKKAFVLGGTVPHKYLIKDLKSMGYYVYLIDYTDNPPAKDDADEQLKVSTLDKDVVLALAKEKEINLIITTCIDQANSTACYVAEQLGLYIPYSYKTSLDVTRKGLMKEIFMKNRIPTSQFYLLDKDQQYSIKMDYPFVIKPTDANSSKGVYKIENENEFTEKIQESFSFSREGKVIVEGFVDGTEIQVDCLAIDGKAHVLMTRDKTTLKQEKKELQVSGFEIPGKQCEKYYTELKEIAQKIVQAFGLINTAFFYQAICNETGVYVLEFAPRIAGGTTYEMVEIFSGCNYLKAAENCFLNIKNEITINKNEDVYVVRFIYMNPGVYEEIKGLDEMIQKHHAKFFPFVKKGKIISQSMNSGNRIGAIMLKRSNYAEAEILMDDIFQNLYVLDDKGHDCSFWR